MGKILDLVKLNSRYLRISEIEKSVGCPVYTLSKFVNGERGVPDKWILPIEELVSGIFNVGVGVPEVIYVEPLRYSVTEEPKEVKDIFDKIKEKMVKEKKEKKKKESVVPVEVKDELERKLESIVVKSNVIDMDRVDVTTGEVKGVLVRPAWCYNRIAGNFTKVDNHIMTDGNVYEVTRMFGSIIKYCYFDSLENARRVVASKDPLNVELF